MADQVKPLRNTKQGMSDDVIYSVHQSNIINSTHKNDPFPIEFITKPRAKCIKCIGCCTAVFLILVMILLVLMFTAFHIKNPIISLNSVDIEGAEVLNSTTSFQPGQNVTMVADVSIKNPNVASFEIISNSTVIVYYDGYVIGEAWISEGRVCRARRSMRVNVTVDVIVDEMLKVPRFQSDLGLEILPISMSTMVNGKVRILDVIRRDHLVVRMNCTMNVNVNSDQVIRDLNCRRRVS